MMKARSMSRRKRISREPRCTDLLAMCRCGRERYLMGDAGCERRFRVSP